MSAFISQLDAVGVFVTGVLVSMSIVTWCLIVLKSIRVSLARRRSAQFAEHFWNSSSLDQALESAAPGNTSSLASALAISAISAARHHGARTSQRIGDAISLDELVTRTLRQAIAAMNAKLESGLTVLASVGSTAPFVGLFGTVWGIYHAMIAISEGGISTLDKVAGPVGEALIMTAAGLVVAIPAVLAYNALTRSNRLALAELDGFAHDLHTYLTTGSRIKHVASDAARSTEISLASSPA